MKNRGVNVLLNLQARFRQLNLRVLTNRMPGCLTVSLGAKPMTNSQNATPIRYVFIDIVMPAAYSQERVNRSATLFNHFSVYQKTVSMESDFEKAGADELDIVLWDVFGRLFAEYGFRDMVFGYDEGKKDKKGMIEASYYRPTLFFNAIDEDKLFQIVVQMLQILSCTVGI